VQHSLVTFIVPDELCSLLRVCPKEGYDAIFEAGSATIQKLLGYPKWLGSPNVGFFGVLHTWGRDPIIFHPHVHFIVPCGGVIGMTNAEGRIIYRVLPDHATPYLDSG